MKKQTAREIERAMAARLDMATTDELIEEIGRRTDGMVIATLANGADSFCCTGTMSVVMGLSDLIGFWVDRAIEQRMG